MLCGYWCCVCRKSIKDAAGLGLWSVLLYGGIQIKNWSLAKCVYIGIKLLLIIIIRRRRRRICTLTNPLCRITIVNFPSQDYHNFTWTFLLLHIWLADKSHNWFINVGFRLKVVKTNVSLKHIQVTVQVTAVWLDGLNSSRTLSAEEEDWELQVPSFFLGGCHWSCAAAVDKAGYLPLNPWVSKMAALDSRAFTLKIISQLLPGGRKSFAVCLVWAPTAEIFFKEPHEPLSFCRPT